VLGAALAGVFGIGQALYLEKRKRAADRRFACGVVGRELKRMLEWRDLLLEAENKNVVYGRFVPVNSFIQFRSLLSPDVLSDSDLTLIEEAYRDYETRDRMMELILTQYTSPEAVKEQARARLAYWAGLYYTDTGDAALKLEPVITRLLEHAAEPTREDRLFAEVKNGLGLGRKEPRQI
jgi:predicted outer membrane lipoprotein